MSHAYFKNRVKVPSFSEFNLSHSRKMSATFGKLFPCNVIEAYPGEKYKINSEQLVRMAPMLAPVMDEVAIDVNTFAVPFRILWDSWEGFITGDNDEEHPYMEGLSAVDSGDLGEFLGYTPGGTNTDVLPLNALPLAAYLKIYDDWYRDQNLQDTQFPDGGLVSGDNTGTLSGYLTGIPLAGSLQHDYFTSALPFPQKGPDVRIPVFQNGDGTVILDPDSTGTVPIIRDGSDHSPAPIGEGLITGIGGQLATDGSGDPVTIDPNNTLIISEQEIGTIRALRLANVLQEWYEKQAVAGSRYNETILSHFGTHTGDSRLDRAEHIGGYTQKIRFSEVLATAETSPGSETIPVGYMGGHGISYGQSRTHHYQCREHCVIISIMRIRPKTSYYQGIQPFFTRSDRFDYMWPDFANIGDQQILKRELYLGISSTGSETNDTLSELNEVFGYQERYAELKTGFDTIHGDFRESLSFWHLSRQFDALPDLNYLFIRADQNEYTRIFAVTEGPDYLYVQMMNNVLALRPLPVYSDPTL